MYPRVIGITKGKHSKGSLLATFERYTYEKPVFSIFKSDDQGLTWYPFSDVHDTKNGWGMRYQPQLFEIQKDCGKIQAGTLLCAGNSIPDDMSQTELLLFKSEDGGLTWDYMSSIDKGGRAMVELEEGERPVWEPYLYHSSGGDLVCYYSDERYNREGYNQLLCHRVSSDGGYTWGEEVFDVAIPDGKLRPGMPIVQLLPNGKYIMVYEIVGLPGYPIYCRFSPDGLDWGDPADIGVLIQDREGAFLGSTPYCVWTDAGGEAGTIIVSGRIPDTGEGLLEPGYFLINRNNGEGPWEKQDCLTHYDSKCHFAGYSQSMVVLEDHTFLQISSVQISPRLAQIAYGRGKIVE
nr:sialidase family protein [uncultured Sphaerochaeta sp.]